MGEVPVSGIFAPWLLGEARLDLRDQFLGLTNAARRPFAKGLIVA